MSLRKFNECFKQYYQNTVLNESLDEINNNDLRKDLLDTVDNLINNGVTNIKEYEVALQNVIENHYPDNSWWDVCSLNIFWHLFTERNPMSTVDAIMDNLTVSNNDNNINEDYQDWDIMLEDDDVELDLKTGELKVPTDIVDDFVKDALIKVKFVEDPDKVHEYKMVSEDGEYITMELLDSYNSPMELEEAANPENEEVNKLIRDIVNGDSRAYGKLRKLGYEVEIDDSARKEFGKDHFGKRIQIVNKETGRMIYADPGHRWKSDDGIIARPSEYVGEHNKRNFHTIKGKGYRKPQGATPDPTAFDYKGYLDKPLNSDKEKPTTVQQFKQDKRFIQDNEYTLKRGKEAEDRLAAIRSRFKKEGLNESVDIDDLLTLLIKEYDEYCDPTVDFQEDLNEFLKYLTIYTQDSTKWFTKDPQTIFELGMEHCNNNDSYTNDFTDFVRGALSEIVFGFTSKFEPIYEEHKSR